MSNNNYQLSIIIVSWNTMDSLKLCLDSLFTHLKGVSFQAIVVDNASDDGSADMVSQQYPPVVLIRNTDNVGFGAAVNQVAHLVVGEYILLLNSDALFIDDDFYKLIQVLDNDQSIGIITGEMLNLHNEPMPSYFEFPGYWHLVKANTIDVVHRVGRTVRGKARNCVRGTGGGELCEVDWVSGGYLVVRHSLVGQGPIFDPRLFMFFEDTLLCRKVWSMGYKVVFAPVARVLHEQGGSTKKRLNESLLASFMSSRVYIREVYDSKALNSYDRTVRLIWRMLRRVLIIISYLGLKRKAGEKVKQLEYLIHRSTI